MSFWQFDAVLSFCYLAVLQFVSPNQNNQNKSRYGHQLGRFDSGVWSPVLIPRLHWSFYDFACFDRSPGQSYLWWLLPHQAAG